jgi:HK97 family phage portal protein
MKPNVWQTRTSYWLDAASNLVRWGNHYCHKGRGSTGPIRALTSLQPGDVEIEQLDDWSLRFHVTQAHGPRETYTIDQMHHARGPARNGYKGDSPVMDMREAIALEMASEKFGGALFGNGATPGVVMKYATGFVGHRNEEDRRAFIESFQATFSGKGRGRAWLMPNGIELDKTIDVANDKAQYLETRKHQRTVIAGAFGVPPHYVGDLENGTFNNVEQQTLGFVVDVVLPYVRIFESALERDLLTDEDRRSGIVIRFNVDGALRGDFKSRQEGLNIMRQAGVVSANDWREHENMNPISSDDGGDEYWRQGPSGQSAQAGTQPGASTEEGDDE